MISNLKLRSSWGETGNCSIDNYASISLLDEDDYSFGGTSATGIYPSTNPNANLTWETTQMTDVGLDIGIMKNALNIKLDYYHAFTSGMLLEVPVPAHSGYTTSFSNVGKSENIGYEAEFSSKLTFGKLNWNARFNFSINRNKILALGPDQEYIQTWFTTTEIGKPISSYWGYKSLGVLRQEDIDNGYPVRSDAKPGYTYKWQDTNNDGKIDENDKTILGDYFPDYSWGLTNSFDWKGIDFSFLIQSVQGFEIFNYTRLWTINPEGWSPLLKEAEDYSRYVLPCKNQTDKSYQRSSLLVEDGSYIRFKNITLGYTLPQSLSQPLRIKKLRVYASAENPITITKYTGSNPEVSSRNTISTQTGIDYGNYPTCKIYSFGLNLTF